MFQHARAKHDPTSEAVLGTARASSEYIFWLPRHETSPGRARTKLRTFLGRTAAGGLYRDVGELLLTELVTNAVRHAREPHGSGILNRFALAFGLLHIEVHDGSSTMPLRRPATGEAEAGRGLLLVERLSEAWGCSLRADGPGKTVWCLVSPTDLDCVTEHIALTEDLKEGSL
ncbi:hypothetical protein GCM10010441_40470 [Kitasatospora paracochleata]